MNSASTPPALRRSRPRIPSALGSIALAGLLAIGCRTVDNAYVWVDTLKGPANGGPYLIGPGDTLSVRVFNQDAISGNVRVRSDGMITMPLVNDVEAEGSTPAELAQLIQAKLMGFLVNPVVTVALQEARPLEVSLIGEVQRPGIYKLEPGAGVLTALAAASGFNDFADRERIFVVRSGRIRIRFTYAALSKARERAAQFRLEPGDVVVVE